MAKKNWIKKAINPKHKGYCTPMTKSTCTPRRKALAKRFKKGGDLHKGELGAELDGNQKEQNDLMQQNQNMLTPGQLPIQDPGQVGNEFIHAMGSDPGVGTTLPRSQPPSIRDFAKRIGSQPQVEQDPMITEQQPASPTRTLQQTSEMLGTSLPQEGEDNPQLRLSIKNRKLTQRQERSAKDPSRDYIRDYYIRKGVQFGDSLTQARIDRNTALESGDAQALKAANIHKVGAGLGIAGAVIGKTMETGKLVAGLFSKGVADANARKIEQEQRVEALRDSDPINPFRSDDSQLGGGTRAPMSKYGRKLALGGKLGYIAKNGIDFESDAPNLEVEGPGKGQGQGEVLAETNSNTVTNFNNKDTHEGANPPQIRAGGGSAVLPIRLGNTVGAFKEKFKEHPYIVDAISNKWDDDKKKISWADVGELFNTKPEAKALESIGISIKKDMKKLGDNEKRTDSPNVTKVDQVTATLNTKTLGNDIQGLRKQGEKVRDMMAAKTSIITDVIYPKLAKAKERGDYGKEVAEDTGKAKLGIKLPKAGTGDKISAAEKRRQAREARQDARWNKSMNRYENPLPTEEIAPGTGPLLPGQTLPNGDDQFYSEAQQVAPLPLTTTPTPPITTQAPAAKSKYSIPDLGGGRNTLNAQGNLVYDPTDITHFRTQVLYPGDKYGSKHADQQPFGAYPGWNAAPGLGQPKEVMDQLATAGFTPKNGWKNVTGEDVQEFLIDKDKNNKTAPYSVMRGLYDKFKNTEQGRAWAKENNIPEGATFDELGEKGVEAFFKDKKYGIRTGLAAEVLSSWRPKKEDKPAEAATPSEVEKFSTTVKGGPGSRRGIYHEGLNPAQYAASLVDLLTPIQAVPYIEDHGAKDALAASTKQRYTDIQPQLNRLRRGTLAQTRNRGTSPVDQARAAQAYANEYEAANQVYGEKYNRDAQIEQNYINQQNELRMRAGTNKAQALDTLAQRTATRDWKATALFRNAVGDIGNKYMQQQVEDRASALYQDMFPMYGYDPISGGTDYQGTWTPQVGLAKVDPMNRLSENGKYEVNETIKPDGTREYTRKLKTAAPSSKKYGGKLPKTMPKKR